MPRNIAGIYSLPPGIEAIDGELADPLSYNLVLNDFRIDANMVRPVGAGGTGAATLADFATALGAVANLNTRTGLLGRSANLSDLANVGTALTNLGFSSLGKSKVAASASFTFTAGTDAQGQGPIPATDETVIVTVAASSPSGVTLPAIAAGDVGKTVRIWNKTGNLVNVYPPSGAQIDNRAVNIPGYVPPEYVGTFVYASPTLIQSSLQLFYVESTDQATWNAGTVTEPLLISPAQLKGTNQWEQIAERNRALDTSVTNLTYTTSHGYRYRIEGRFVSRADTSGLVVSFNGGASFTIPFGVAASTYDFRVEYDSRASTQKVFTVDGMVAVSPGLNGMASATPIRFIHSANGAYINNTGDDATPTGTTTIQCGTNDGSGVITVYRRPIY